jgi:hypothetical protein
VFEIPKTNRCRKAGGCCLSEQKVAEAFAECYRPQQVAEMVNREGIWAQAIALILGKDVAPDPL